MKNVPYGNEKCVFPKLSRAAVDPRGLKVGDRVCYWDYTYMVETKILSITPPNSLLKHPMIYTLGEISNNTADKDWHLVGVFQPLHVSKTAVGKIAENKNLPEDIENVIKKFGGRKRRSTLRKQKRRRSVKRRRIGL